MSRPLTSPAVRPSLTPPRDGSAPASKACAGLVAGSCLSCWTRAPNSENASPQSGAWMLQSPEPPQKDQNDSSAEGWAGQGHWVEVLKVVGG